MKTSENWNASRLIEILYVRKELVVATCLVVLILTVYVARSLPNIFRSSTLILVTHQIPASKGEPLNREDREERIHAMAEQVLSRVKLERVVSDLNLYAANGRPRTMDERVENLQKHIKINIDRTDTFRLSYEAERPDLAMRVTARLSALLIDENVKLQEQQLSGANVVLNAEVERLRKDLDKQEGEISRYRARNRQELPEQMEANMATLNQLRSDLQTNALRLSELREKKAALEQQIVEAEAMPRGSKVEAASRGDGGDVLPRWKEIENRKAQLETLLAQYSEKHPDVMRMKREIQTLEQGETSMELKRKEGSGEVPPATKNPLHQALTKQLGDLNSEIRSFQSSNERLRGEIASYLGRVNSAPIRGEELAKISRTYEVTLKKYQDLVGQGLDSQHLRNVEYKQARAQFQILDPANYPERPVRPNRMLILLTGLLVGVAGGLALAFIFENQNTSFKDGEELAEYVDVPLLATIPAFTTRGSVLEKRRARGILVVASIGATVFGLACVRFFLPALPF